MTGRAAEPARGRDALAATRVAALYDVHGNLPALEAVLADLEGADVDLVVVGGDVLPGPMPRESLAALSALEVPVVAIRGNGENDVLALDRGEPIDRVPQSFRPVMRWVADELSSADLRRLAGWPASVEVDVAKLGRVLFCHATPRDDNEILTRLTPEHRLIDVFGGIEADLVVCGHTHMQFDRTVGHLRVVNAGSVGMPFGEPGAYWLLLGPGVEPRVTPYDRAAASERLAASAYPGVPGGDVLNPPSEVDMLAVFEGAAGRS